MSMTWNAVLIVVCLMFSAFFSGSETAFTTVNPLRLEQAANARGGRFRAAYRVLQRFDRALIAVLVGNNLVNILSSSLATAIAISLMGESGAWVATAAMTVLIVLFGEVLPKITAAENANAFAGFAARPLEVVMVVLWPVTFVLNAFLRLLLRLWKHRQETPAVTEEDLETIIETVEDEGVVDEDTCDLMQSALDFDDVLAYEIITPRVDLVALDIDDEREELLRTVFASPFTRLPVYEDTVDNVIGVLHLNRFFKELVKNPDADIRSLLLPVAFVHKTMPLDDVLKVMRQKKCHMVVVTDEYGGTMGVLTMEDVLEQLVGDIWDETDEIVNEFAEVGDNRYEVDGDMRFGDFLAEFDKEEEDFDEDNATVGGWAVEKLGGYPKLRESFVFENLTVTIIKKNNLRVIRLLVEEDPDWEPEEEEDRLIPYEN